MQTSKLSQRIVAKVISEIMSRKGFQAMWADVKPDIRKEILASCRNIVQEELKILS